MKAVIYARFSSSGQQETSIEFQVEDCRKFAQQNGYEVVAVFEDKAKSATTDNRPQFLKMIDYCENARIDAIICWKRDRFARNREDSAIYKKRLRKVGVKILYSAEANIETADGIIADAMMEAIAEWYSKNLSNNIKAGNKKAAEHRRTLGHIPFGLKQSAEKQFILDEEKAPVVKRIFEMYSEGSSIKDIIKTYPQYHFTYNGLYVMLKNPKYYGLYKESGIEELCIPPIVSKELWDQVQTRKRTMAKSPNHKEEYLLTGKLHCGRCGRLMVADQAKNGQYLYYCCVGRKKHICDQERISKDETENAVLEKLKEIISDDNVVEALADHYISWQNEQINGEYIQSLKAEKQALQKRIDRCYELILFDDVYKTKLAEAKNRLNEVEGEILRTEGIIFTKEMVVSFLKNLRIEKEEVEWNRSIIETFLVTASYDKDEIALQVGQAEYGTTSPTLVDINKAKSYFANGCLFVKVAIRKEVVGG